MGWVIFILYVAGIIGTTRYAMGLFNLHWADINGSGLNGIGARFKTMVPGTFWPIGLPILLLVAQQRQGHRQATRQNMANLMRGDDTARNTPAPQPEHRTRNPFDDI
ncbi:hypothetical protein OHU34_18960 [Streptomyces sp. NBC_00080]|uniref:hypothetical protein n=1 Tax=Streptomyces TaxID=1883 RepID=UPI001153DEA5|nr:MULTISPECIES: hypothetical protein [Streptomyces]TQJ54735.1 hypothetical protein FBY34_2520 [Streptomyces sp. SLBN-115]